MMEVTLPLLILFILIALILGQGLGELLRLRREEKLIREGFRFLFEVAEK